MKKFLIGVSLLLLTSGCSITDEFSDNYLYTTMYPIEYAAQSLYGDYAKIESVYPNGADNTYMVTDKKKNKYANGEYFIYSGVAKEAYLAKDLLNLNGEIKLIDASRYVPSDNGYESIWLDPSNFLKVCNNIKTSLIDYNDNVYIKEDIEEKYKELNETISELDVKLYDIGKNGNYNTILVTNDVFTFLEKYNINVISIDPDNQNIDKAYAEAKKMIENKKISYVFSLSNETLTQTQEKFINTNSLVKITINDLFTISDDERDAEEDYITLMNKIIENYKKELYKK